jgi:predicted nucleic acid-binding protein
MKYLVDTNVISEMTKAKPNENVIKWFTDNYESDMFLSVMSIGEIVFGISKHTDENRKKKLSVWLDSVICEGFLGRIIEIDTAVMTAWGEMTAKLPRPLQTQDTLIAATAIAHNMTVVTRNVQDFEDIANLKILNPFTII